MKLKRSTTVPLVLLLYLIVVSIYTWPGKNPELSHVQYGLTIGVTLICIILLTYFLRKKEEQRNKNRTNDKK